MWGRSSVFALVCGAVSACQAQPLVEEAEPRGPSCGAARLSGWIGHDATTLDEQYLPQIVRLIRPGDAITEDHNPGRLNVVLSRANRIEAFYCG